VQCIVPGTGSSFSFHPASTAQREANETLAIVANVCIMTEPAKKKRKPLTEDAKKRKRASDRARGSFVEKKHQACLMSL
ncbi:hypothetical protein AALO_G00001660, partial [Alosa alosa]